MDEEQTPGRSLIDTARPTEGRIIAGVAAGIGRQLDIDPVVVRIGFVALTFVGLAGPILYLAGWFLFPQDGKRSIAADWFNLSGNERQVRTAGLFAAGVLALAAAVGDAGWGGWSFGWIALPAAFGYWLFVVRPRLRREQLLAAWDPAGHPPVSEQVEQYTRAKVADALAKREAKQPARPLMLLTASVAVIGLAATLIADRAGSAHITGLTYLAVALGAVAMGCLIGSVYGNPVPLYGIGTLLAAALILGSLVPAGPIGDEKIQPKSAADLATSYRHGVGRFELDLSHLKSADLVGHRVRVTAGIGETDVLVSREVPVRVIAHLGIGEMEVFDRVKHGYDNTIRRSDDQQPYLEIDVDQHVGQLTVEDR
jgi:phage shock protein PspC (stress-responsive transcriptional regulator)